MRFGVLLKLFACILALTLCACNFFAPAPPDQSQIDARQTLVVTMEQLRQAATREHDRLLVTQEAIQTAVREVELANTRTAVTMIALGMPLVDAAQITPAAPDSLPAAAGNDAQPVIVTPGGSAQTSPNANSTDQAVPTPAAPSDPNTPYLTNVATTEQVGTDDCAVSLSSSFASTTPGVYAVATAFNLTTQNVITYRWLRDGVEIWVDTWSPAGTTNGQCIWYYVTPAEIEFVPGNWSVEILIDGSAVAPSVTFTITG